MIKDFVKIWLDSLPTASGSWFYILLIITSIVRIYDGLKYHVQCNKIRRVKTAKSQSRDFINIALASDIVMILWIMFKVKDTLLFLTGVLALLFVIELFWVTYKYYDYRQKCYKTKLPSIWIYFVNSLISDKTRKHL